MCKDVIMKKTIIAVLILVPATLLTSCVTQRSSYSSGYNTDYFYKKSTSPNLGVVSYGLDFGKGYGLSYGPGDYGNGDYANCKYGNCDYPLDYGNSYDGSGSGSGDYKYVVYNNGYYKNGYYKNGYYKNGYYKNGYYKNGYYKNGRTYSNTWYSKSVEWRQVDVDRSYSRSTRWDNNSNGWYYGDR